MVREHHRVGSPVHVQLTWEQKWRCASKCAILIADTIYFSVSLIERGAK